MSVNLLAFVYLESLVAGRGKSEGIKSSSLTWLTVLSVSGSVLQPPVHLPRVLERIGLIGDIL